MSEIKYSNTISYDPVPIVQQHSFYTPPLPYNPTPQEYHSVHIPPQLHPQPQQYITTTTITTCNSNEINHTAVICGSVTCFILGFFIGITWLIGAVVFRNSSSSIARLFSKLSLILLLIGLAIGFALAIGFFVAAQNTTTNYNSYN